MDLFDRIYKLHSILGSSRYPVSRARLQKELECSRATVNRCIRDLRNYLQAPVEFDRQACGYRYATESKSSFELPGLWFNASELQALLAMQHLLSEVQPGLLEPHLDPLRQRIEEILSSRSLGGKDIRKRIRYLGMAWRQPDACIFRTTAAALMQRKRLRITYHSRSRNETTIRDVSPQRVVHYRGNWYLDVWDHTKQALRSFAVERIRQADPLKQSAQKITDSCLDAHFASAYGIFAGKPKHKAVLRFSSERTQWVAEEQWHPKQKGRFENGYYILEVPYSDSRELVMDILKHGEHVEVLAPDTLRAEVIRQMQQALVKQKHP